jgi:hypothetical protein
MRPDLRAAAELARTLGWEIVPVIGKKPRVMWRQPPAHYKVDKLLDDPETTGLAVVLGQRSGGLVARDFDQRDAYEQWKLDQPELARTLPTSRTGRPEGGYHVYATMHGAPLVRRSDGELRGNGGIVVMPPSVHPSGSRYEWINLPKVTPLEVTLEQLNVFVSESAHSHTAHADTKQTQAEPEQTQATHAYTSIAYVEYQTSIERCIEKNLPSGPGQRNHCLFNLARDLREFLPRDTPKSVLIHVARRWHHRALPSIRTKDLIESVGDFLIAWSNVKWPKGTLWHQIISAATSDSFALPSEYEDLNPIARPPRIGAPPWWWLVSVGIAETG